MSLINFNSTTPAPPTGSTNVTFAYDSNTNVSASVGIVIGSAGVSSSRQQLSVGSYFDLYSGAANSPTVPSLRGTATAAYLNAFGTGTLGLNYDSGTGGVTFYNGSGTQVGIISSTGAHAVALATAPRMQLSVGTNLDINSQASGTPPTPTVPNIVAVGNQLQISSYGTSAVYINSQSGTGGLAICNGAGVTYTALYGTGAALFGGNVGIGVSARQNLSIGSSLDLYSAASANSPTVPSIRSTGAGLILNGYSTSGVALNYDTGTGGVVFYNGSGTAVASITSIGAMAVGSQSNPRQQLSVGSYLDIYSGSANSPTVPSLRSTATATFHNAYGAGTLGFNYDSGTGGVTFYNGAGTSVASVSSAGAGVFASLSVSGTSALTALTCSTLTASGNVSATAGLGTFYSLSVVGSTASVRGVATPAAPTVTTGGTAGTSSYSYAVTALQTDGSMTAASPATVIATGNATLSSTNYNTIAWTAVTGAVSYNVYRLTAGGTSPTTVGKIASAITAVTFNDTGVAGDGTTATTVQALQNVTGLNLQTPLGGTLGGWTSYTPLYSCNGSMTISSVTTTTAQYIRVGPIMFFQLDFSGTLGGTASTEVIVSLPCALVGNFVQVEAAVISNGSISYTPTFANLGASSVGIVLPGTATFTLGTCSLTASGFYRCA